MSDGTVTFERPPAAAPTLTLRDKPQPMLPMWAQRTQNNPRQFTVRRETEAGLCEDWGRTGWSATEIPWTFTHDQATAIVGLLQNQRG
jgi:hypothetical protein